MNKKLFSVGLNQSIGSFLAQPVLSGKADDALIWTATIKVSVALLYDNNVRETVIMERHSQGNLLYCDTKTFEFDLRKDLKFNDGTGFDVDYVVATFNHVTAQIVVF